MAGRKLRIVFCWFVGFLVGVGSLGINISPYSMIVTNITIPHSRIIS